VRELLERIAAGVGADTRVELKDDAEGASAEFLGEYLGLVIATMAGTNHTFGSTQDITVRPLDSPARGAETRLLLGEALHEYAPTRIRLSP